jgi:hypothetical protein
MVLVRRIATLLSRFTCHETARPSHPRAAQQSVPQQHANSVQTVRVLTVRVRKLTFFRSRRWSTMEMEQTSIQSTLVSCCYYFLHWSCALRVLRIDQQERCAGRRKSATTRHLQLQHKEERTTLTLRNECNMRAMHAFLSVRAINTLPYEE